MEQPAENGETDQMLVTQSDTEGLGLGSSSQILRFLFAGAGAGGRGECHDQALMGQALSHLSSGGRALVPRDKEAASPKFLAVSIRVLTGGFSFHTNYVFTWMF